MIGLPPLSWMRESSSNVRVFGLLALPKNSTQNAGSNENEANEEDCPYDAPSAEAGRVTSRAVDLVQNGKQVVACAATRSKKLERPTPVPESVSLMLLIWSRRGWRRRKGQRGRGDVGRSKLHGEYNGRRKVRGGLGGQSADKVEGRGMLHCWSAPHMRRSLVYLARILTSIAMVHSCQSDPYIHVQTKVRMIFWLRSWWHVRGKSSRRKLLQSREVSPEVRSYERREDNRPQPAA